MSKKRYNPQGCLIDDITNHGGTHMFNTAIGRNTAKISSRVRSVRLEDTPLGQRDRS